MVAAIAIGVGMLVRLLRRKGASWSAMAWRVMQAGGVAFVLSVLLYQKPGSFYTNFVVIPSMLLFLGGVLAALVTIVFGTMALIKREATRKPLIAMATAVLSAIATILLIMWRAR